MGTYFHKTVFILICTVSLAAQVIAQKKILVLENIKTKKIETIREKKLVQVTLNNSDKFEGNFLIVNDSTIKFNKDVILIKNIFYLRTFTFNGEAVKITAILGGIIAAVAISAFIPSDESDLNYLLLGLGFSADIAAATALFKLGQNNDLIYYKSEWNYYIINEIK